MANKKISSLPEKVTPSQTDIVPIVDTQDPDNLTTKKTTVGAILDTLSAVTDADKGVPGGVATLGEDGKVPAIQLPQSYGATGATGPQGLIGLRGATGVAGPTGATGIVGASGPTGPAGPSGAVGPTGASGPQGSTGARGLTGPTGAAGVTGATGPAGVTGATGPRGATGAVGPAGVSGATGAAGLTGATGPRGATGVTGNTGSTGATGAVGTAGATGPVGVTGATGPQGVAGVTGNTGATGPQGPAGSGVTIRGTATSWPPAVNPTAGDMWIIGPPVPSGSPVGSNAGDGVVWTGSSWENVGPVRGPQGDIGVTGATGPQGATGVSGNDGATGATGPQGVPGDKGDTGDIGATGPTGPAGATTLDELTDVTLTEPTTGQVLKYDGSNWVNSADETGGGGGSTTLDALTDVAVTAPSTGQVLKYDGTNWINDADISTSQLITYNTADDFPATGTNELIYVDLSTNRLYIWRDDTYVEISGAVGPRGPRGLSGTSGYTLSATTTDSTPTVLTGDSLSLGLGEAWQFEVKVVAINRKTGAARVWWVSGGINRGFDGTTALIDSLTPQSNGNLGAESNFSVTAGTGALVLTATGLADADVKWTATVMTSEVTTTQQGAGNLVGGCTDSDASNYDASADYNDGSCSYSAAPTSANLKAITSNDPITGLTVTVGANELYPEFDTSIQDYYVLTTSAYSDTADYSVSINGGAAITGTTRAGKTLKISDGTNYYYVRLLPSDMHTVSATYGPTGSYWAGYYLTSPTDFGVNSPYYCVYDSNGVPVWYGKSTATFPGGLFPGIDLNNVFMNGEHAKFKLRLNAASITRRSVSLATSPTYGSLAIDIHDCLEIAAPLSRWGNILLLAYSQGFYIQEQDSAGNLVWEWHSKEYFNSQDPEYYHINSVHVHPVTGNLVVSMRNSSAVMCIDYATKDVLWVLQGTPSPSYDTMQATAKSGPTANTKWLTISGEPVLNGYQYSGTIAQHDARWLPDSYALTNGNTVVSVFDNQSQANYGFTTIDSEQRARGVIYEIDLAAGTATHRSSIFSESGTSPFMGSYRVMENNGVITHLVDFVTQTPRWVEYTGDIDGEKTKVLAADYIANTYRVVKVPLTFLRADNLRATCGIDADTGAFLAADPEPPPPPAGVNPVLGALAFWKLADLTDSTGNDYTLTNNGGVTFSAGKIGNAAYFNGSQSLSLGSTLPLTGRDFSVSLWFKSTNDGDHYFASAGSSDNCFYVVCHPGGDVLASVSDGTTPLYAGVTNASDGNWHHVVVTRTATTKKLYYDGTLAATATGSYGPLNTCSALHLGSNWSGNYAPLVGALDAVGVWNRALSAAEVTTLYNNGTGTEVINALPSLLMHFDGDFADSSANNVTVTAQNGAITDDMNFKYGTHSAAFTGSEYLSVDSGADLFAFGTGDFTIEFWAKAVANNSSYQVLYDGRAVGVDGPQPTLYLDGDLHVVYYTNSDIRIVGGTISVDNFAHVALTRKDGVTKLFINGNYGDSWADATDYTNASGRPLIGSDGFVGDGSNGFAGYIDELRVIKGAATYTDNFTPPTQAFSNPYASDLLLHFDDNFGDNVFTDASLNNLALTAGDFSEWNWPPINNIDTDVFQPGNSNRGAAYFHGSNQGYIAVDNAEFFNFGSDNFTIEAWVNPENANKVNSVVSKRASNETQLAFDLLVLNGSSYFVASSNGTSWAINGGGSQPVASNQWSHLALVRDGTSWKIFVNGVLSQSHTNSMSLFNSTQPLRIGSQGLANQSFAGSIDEVRIIKGVAVYTDDFTPPNAPFTL